MSHKLFLYQLWCKSPQSSPHFYIIVLINWHHHQGCMITFNHRGKIQCYNLHLYPDLCQNSVYTYFRIILFTTYAVLILFTVVA